MIIPPLSIEQDGPGIELDHQANGDVMVMMADPVPDFEYARNAVTLSDHLTGA